MKKRNQPKEVLLILKEHLFSLLLFIAIFVMVLVGLQEAMAGNAEEEKRIAEESIQRAVVSCYAIEGFYPDSFDYIREHYNVRIDESKYYVDYSIFASNIMPDITVIEVPQ